jgi:hypothetical protein
LVRLGAADRQGQQRRARLLRPLRRKTLGLDPLHVNVNGRLYGVVSPVVQRAEEQCVTLVIETIEDVDPLARAELARASNSRRVRVLIDTGHAAYAHSSTGAPPVDDYVRAAGDMLEHVPDGFANRRCDRGGRRAMAGGVLGAGRAPLQPPADAGAARLRPHRGERRLAFAGGAGARGNL